jgi:SAM-dependent methyltransferase
VNVVRQPRRVNGRAHYDRALLQARLSAFAPGEFVGQESFMGATEILQLAARAGVAPGVAVLDLCCGVGGPGLLISRELGCSYVGIDEDAEAIGVARQRALDLDCRFEVARVPPIPRGPYDVVLMLETLLAFADKESLLQQVAAVLDVGGRLAVTAEEGPPLTAAERSRMPASGTVWPVALPDLLSSLDRAGLRVTWQTECTQAHRSTAAALHDAFRADAHTIAAQLGRDCLHDLLTSHRLWRDWLRDGRVRKFALVAEKVAHA